MNTTTHDFLTEFTPKLETLFDKELSSVYLNSMNEHLETFYNDVLAELKNKEKTMLGRIEGKPLPNFTINFYDFTFDLYVIYRAVGRSTEIKTKVEH